MSYSGGSAASIAWNMPQAREKEIENEKRGIAAREARLERLRACVEDRGRLRSVAAKERPSSVWLG